MDLIFLLLILICLIYSDPLAASHQLSSANKLHSNFFFTHSTTALIIKMYYLDLLIFHKIYVIAFKCHISRLAFKLLFMKILAMDFVSCVPF